MLRNAMLKIQCSKYNAQKYNAQNTMLKIQCSKIKRRKDKTMVKKALHRKLKIEHELH
jgi:hypothetical protein